MAKSTGATLISSVNLYTAGETNPTTALGSLTQTQDGRKFRYVLAGGTTLVAGNLQQSQAEQTNFKDMAAQAIAAIGATTIPVTLGATATTSGVATAGNMVGGILVVSGTPGIGQYSNIISHDVAAASATANFVIEDPLTVATSTASLISVYPNLWRNCVIHVGSATNTGIALGVAPAAIVNAKFGWVQTGGLGACLADATATTAAIQAVSPSVGTAGAVTRAITLNERIGISYAILTVSARVEPLWLEID